MATRWQEKFVRWPRKTSQSLSFIVVAGLGEPAQLKKLGIERTLIKPLRRATLYEAIRHGLKVPVPPKRITTHLPKEKYRALRLLLVEDNRVNQKLALRLLEKWGIESLSPSMAGKRLSC